MHENVQRIIHHFTLCKRVNIPEGRHLNPPLALWCRGWWWWPAWMDGGRLVLNRMAKRPRRGQDGQYNGSGEKML